MSNMALLNRAEWLSLFIDADSTYSAHVAARGRSVAAVTLVMGLAVWTVDKQVLI
jgi:hypothetical protein